MRVEACPKRSATMRFDTPPWISQLANVRLRSFGVTRGTPARAQARARSRVTLDHGLTTGPVPRWSAARIGLISSWIGTERPTVLPIGTAIMPRCRYQVVRFDPKGFRQRRPDPRTSGPKDLEARGCAARAVPARPRTRGRSRRDDLCRGGRERCPCPRIARLGRHLQPAGRLEVVSGHR